MSRKFRLVTRSDFDGLICAVLLKMLDLIDTIKFVHPKDMQDGKVEITDSDITTNLPYIAIAHLVFDHHYSEALRNPGQRPENYILDPNAPSTARVVYDYYGGQETFPNINDEMLEAVDKADAAQFSREEILFPQRWVLLNYIMDPRSGLGRFKNFRISNYELMMTLIDYCKVHTIDEILELPDVKERVTLYMEHQREAMAQIERCATLRDNVIILDLREETDIFVVNRFIIYAMYPECNISVHIMWGLQKQNTVFAVGKSIIDRSSKTNVGALMLRYSGGGHERAGTCQIENERSEAVIQELVDKMIADG
ncbi:exopolyphosphatase [Candidatus Albibeggiatoa sp. nov. BB20]|uniref:exopolyphosphatase n=1 Tax=Candidatus Albibeggiatoa sp. nov. BB20 TaxID=3162723 RepID=UPI00336598E9